MLAATAVSGALAAFAPVVVHDSRETSPLASVAHAPAPVPGTGSDPRPALYARATPAGGGGTWLQYWLFYVQQDQDRGIVRTGRHAGDWEMVQVRLDEGGHPVEVVAAQHAGAERCGWATVERRGTRPVVYAARGAHGSYLRPGVRDRLWPDPNDAVDGRGRVTVPRLVRITEGRPAWVRWPGRWGGARARWWIPAEQDSPRGPAFQPDRWARPDAWARAAAACRVQCDAEDECDEAETAVAAGGAAAAAGAVALTVLWHARRRRAGRR